jgi:uncharacterized OsmC-like protein
MAVRHEENAMERSVIGQTEERFRAEPEAARGAPTVSATLANGRARLSSGAFNWEADLPPAIGGGNLAPSPTAYLLGALAGCAVAFLHDTLAPQLGIRVDDVAAVARCTSDSRGLLGMDGVAPDIENIELEISVSSPEPEERIEELYRVWLERCPIYLAIGKPNAIATRLTIGAPVS